MTIKLEHDKKYVRRDGEITGPLEWSGNPSYPFRDPDGKNTYNADGYWTNDETPHDFDLVREYMEDEEGIFDGPEEQPIEGRIEGRTEGLCIDFDFSARPDAIVPFLRGGTAAAMHHTLQAIRQQAEAIALMAEAAADGQIDRHEAAAAINLAPRSGEGYIDLDWRALPAWANVGSAMDESGEWYAYDRRPNRRPNKCGSTWDSDGPMVHIPPSHAPKGYTGDWRDSWFPNPLLEGE